MPADCHCGHSVGNLVWAETDITWDVLKPIEADMPFYTLERQSDQKRFGCVAANDAGALFDFSRQVGRKLTFEGDGPPPYLFESRMEAIAFVKPNIPVYSLG